MKSAATMSLVTLVGLIACGRSNETPTPKPNSKTGAGAGAADSDGASTGPRVPPFVDVLPASGITFRHHFLDSETGSTYKVNPYDHGSGVCIADVDGDGLEDLYLLDFAGPNALYRNLGGLRFEDITAKAGIAVARSISVGASFGDYDGDGDPDLYVTTYRGGNHLFRNRGDGTFEDVTAGSGTEYDGHSNSASWFDFDNDGDLDLYLCNIGKFTTETIQREADNAFFQGESLPFVTLAQKPDNRVLGEADKLFRNDGGGKFTDVAAEVGLQSTEWNGDVATADIDLDGDLDLYSSNMFGANHLYLNEGGTFREITNAALGRTSWGGMGARFFDANGDAHPDLYVVDMHSDMWSDPKNGVKGLRPLEKFNTPLGATTGGMVIQKPGDTFATHVLCGNTFFVNDGDGTFSERSREAGLENWWPWGLAIGDFNNDGHEDAFVTAGMGFPYAYWGNHLYLNDGAGRFHERARAAGVEPPRAGEVIAGLEIDGKPFTRSSRTVACADLDLDGDLDLVVNNFNHEPYLLRNDSPESNNWLQLDLRARGGRRPAFGARVEVLAGGRTWYRWLASAEGYLAQNSAVLHVGLGEARAIERVTVHWLGDAEPTVIDAPKIGQRLRVDQP